MNMEIALVIIALIIAAWFWSARQHDKHTTLDFDVWVSKYDSTSSPASRSAMAVSLLQQAIHFAWTLGAINSKQRDLVTQIFKRQGANATMIQFMGSALPSVIRVVGEREVVNSPARVVGALMLVSWMSEEDERESAIRNFLSLRLP